MREMSPKMKSGELDVAIRSAIQTPGQVVVPAAAGALCRLIPERWVVDLLFVTLAALIVGASALWGLAGVSTWAPGADAALSDLRMCGLHTAERVALDACNAPACCREVR
jgi:hypothetical protein